MSGSLARTMARTLAPLLLAVFTSGVILALLGADPLQFYSDVLRLALLGAGLSQTVTALAPLLLVALGLIIAFRAGLWNLSYAGTYVLAAAIVAGLAPQLFDALPYSLALAILACLAIFAGCLVGVLPGLLKAWKGVNEVVTSLMMSFIAIAVANLLIRGIFRDTTITQPQTQVIDLSLMLPFVPGTSVHVGAVLAVVLVVLAHVVLRRSAWGLKIDLIGQNPAAARYAGIRVGAATISLFLVSSAFIALAAYVDVLGLWGYSRAEWNPAYGDKVLPFIFLARLRPLAAVPLVGAYAVLATGGTLAAQNAGVSVDMLSVIVALVLFFMLAIEVIGHRLPLGRSYLTRPIFARGAADE